MVVVHTLITAGLVVAALFIGAPACADDYQLGQGWHAGNYRFAGYANVEIVDRFGKPAKLNLDDLSLFASRKINQWANPFLEIELSGLGLLKQGGGAQGGDLIVERFYNDVILSEQDTLRVGKVLTPLGEWNTVHAAPIVPIISRPYTVARGFAGYLSGINWMHEADQGLISAVQLYWQPGDELFKRPTTQTKRNFHDVIGGRASKSFSLNDRLGLSFQHGTLIESDENYTLSGIDIAQSFGKLKLQSEAISAKISGSATRAHDTEAGIFVLADYAVTTRWHGIVGGEYYRDHMVVPSSRSTILAVSYKPGDVPVVWKLEYIHQAGTPSPIANIRTGLKGSLSLFF